jgi:dTDP-4-dehydrorhamnose reductase
VRILLTGRTGQVGWELERALPSLGALTATGRATLDLADHDALRRAVREAKPEVIVNAAAYTAVDRAETEPGIAMQINAEAPGVLAAEAKRCGALLVHYSTDYVFDGQRRSPYPEEAAPNPINVYGRTKLAGERAIAASNCRYLILRTSWVYAPRGRNFFLAIARKALAGEPLHVVADQEGVPTEAQFIAETTRSLIEGKAQGILHVVPSGNTTWHGFASAIVQRLAAGVSVKAIPSGEYPSAARRPACSILSKEKLERLLGPLPTWGSLLDRCVKAWKPA